MFFREKLMNFVVTVLVEFDCHLVLCLHQLINISWYERSDIVKSTLYQLVAECRKSHRTLAMTSFLLYICQQTLASTIVSVT